MISQLHKIVTCVLNKWIIYVLTGCMGSRRAGWKSFKQWEWPKIPHWGTQRKSHTRLLLPLFRIKLMLLTKKILPVWGSWCKWLTPMQRPLILRSPATSMLPKAHKSSNYSPISQPRMSQIGKPRMRSISCPPILQSDTYVFSLLLFSARV